MWNCYIDESGNTGPDLLNPDQPRHLVSAVLIRASDAKALGTRMKALLTDLGPPGITEFHGTDVYRGANGWKDVDPCRRLSVFDEAVSLLEVFDCAIAYAAIDKPELARRNYPRPIPPHLLALQFTLEKIDQWIHKDAPMRAQVQLFADSQRKYDASVKNLLKIMSEFPYTPIRTTVLRYIDPRIDLVDSSDCPGVQLSDLVAFAMNRTELRRSPDCWREQALADLTMKRIRPRVRKYRWDWPNPYPNGRP